MASPDFVGHANVPLHRGPERGELFTRYRQGIESRKSRLEAVKEREDTTLAAIRKQWADKRAEIERMEIAKRNKRIGSVKVEVVGVLVDTTTPLMLGKAQNFGKAFF